jgi:dolichyl-phosphate beta-glucosyltransferase
VDVEVAVAADQSVQHQCPVVQTLPGPVSGAASPPGMKTALTVVLPCYNEAERLPRTLEAYLAHLSRVPGEVEVLVVDDGSTDATSVVAEAVAAVDARVRVLANRPNRGKGSAVRAGMLAGRGELLVFTDADGSYGPRDLDRIVRALAQAPVAIGTRAEAATGPLTRRAASRAFNLAIRGLLELPFRDTQSGLKGFRRAAAQEIFSRTRLDGFAFDVEALFLARRLGLEIAEVNVQARECQGSKVRMAVDAQRMLGEVWAVRQLAAQRCLRWPTRPPPTEQGSLDRRFLRRRHQATGIAAWPRLGGPNSGC